MLFTACQPGVRWASTAGACGTQEAAAQSTNLAEPILLHPEIHVCAAARETPGDAYGQRKVGW